MFGAGVSLRRTCATSTSLRLSNSIPDPSEGSLQYIPTLINQSSLWKVAPVGLYCRSACRVNRIVLFTYIREIFFPLSS